MFTKWSYQLLTGNAIIDKQHREIFDRAAEMIESGRSGKTKEEAVNTVSYLEDYYARHFAAEEALQLKCRYPEYETHKEMHEAFRRKLAELKQRFALSGTNHALAIETMIFMLDWLANHINKMDKQFAAHIRNAESSSPTPVAHPVNS